MKRLIIKDKLKARKNLFAYIIGIVIILGIFIICKKLVNIRQNMLSTYYIGQVSNQIEKKQMEENTQTEKNEIETCLNYNDLPKYLLSECAQKGTTELRQDHYAKIYRPYGYDSNKKYDVLVLIPGAGGGYGEWMNERYINILDNAIAHGDCNPLIVVSIDYSGITGSGTTYITGSQMKSICNRIKQITIDTVKKYSTYVEYNEGDSDNQILSKISNQREHFGMAGASLGGAVVGYATHEDPCISCFSWFGIFEGYSFNDKEPPKKINYVYFTLGQNGDKTSRSDTNNNMYPIIKNSQNVINYKLDEIQGSGHDWKTWSTSLYNILRLFYIKNIGDADISISETEIYYNGEEIRPEPVVKMGNKTLEKDKDYTVTYSNNINAGTAKVKVKGKGNYTGEKEINFTINKAENTLKVSANELKYTGNEQQLVTVSNSKGDVYYSVGTELTSSNYSTKGSTSIPKRTNVGTYKVYYYTPGNSNYKSKSGNLNVTINNRNLVSIKITKAASKTKYFEKENFDTNGMEVTATYDNETTSKVTNYSIIDGNNLGLGKTSVTISYTENSVTKTTTQNITVSHDYIETVINPTCTEKGYTKHTCKVCGDSYKDNYIEALGHNYESEVVVPTCTEGGYTKHTCTRCGDSYTDNETEALGHAYENGKCTRCGEKEPIVIVESEELEIDNTNNTISKVNTKTTVEDLKEELSTNATSIIVKDRDGKELSNEDKVGTNCKIILTNEYEERVFTLIVTGDVDGDGEADFTDMLEINKYRLKIKLLDEVSLLAGDVNGDNKVDFWDMIEINNMRLGIK